MAARSNKILFLLPGLCVVAAFVGWIFYSLQPPAAASSMQRFQIASGTSFRTISRELKDAGLIRSAAAFDIYAVFTGRARHLKPGRYELSPSDSGPAVAAILAAGPETETTVTIPEGLTAIDIAGILS